MSIGLPAKPFTLKDKLDEATANTADKFLLPSLKDHTDAFKDFKGKTRWTLNSEGPSENPLNSTPYPMMGLGGRPDIGAVGADPPLPVSGPSVPKCGTRPIDPVSDPFTGLSLEMAGYNYKRTSSIMKGAKPGC